MYPSFTKHPIELASINVQAFPRRGSPKPDQPFPFPGLDSIFSLKDEPEG